MSEALKADAAEAEKLLQRLSAAEAQYDQGLSKLSATSRQLQSLSARVSAWLSCDWCLGKTCLEMLQSSVFCTEFSFLALQVKGTQSSAEQLVKILRDVPTKEALALRSEAALKVHPNSIVKWCIQVMSSHFSFMQSIDCRELTGQRLNAGCCSKATESDAGKEDLWCHEAWHIACQQHSSDVILVFGWCTH